MRAFCRAATTVLTCAVLVAGLAPAASARHVPVESCTPSGDVCVSARAIKGVRKLQIGTIEKYFDAYRLCVTAPDRTKRCKNFEIEARGDIYGDSVRWARHFPNKGAGRYTVRWKVDGNVVGRAGFHRR